MPYVLTDARLTTKSLAVCSDGRTFDNPKNLQHSLDRLVLLQKRLSCKQKGSANRNKARIRVARLQEHIANCRKDNLHKITHVLTHDSQVRTLCMENLNVKGMQSNHHLAQAVGDASFGMFLTMLEYKCRWYGVNLVKILCMENLNVKGMQSNHHLAQAVGDASFGMFLTMLEYKCRWYGVNLVKIDRFAPSSKTCGQCGYVYKGLKLLTMLEYKCRWYGVNLVKIDRFAPSSKTCGQCGYVYKGLKLSERSWTCSECGTHHDRDFNAACNIKEFGLKALPTERGKVKPVDCPTVDEAWESQACGLPNGG